MQDQRPGKPALASELRMEPMGGVVIADGDVISGLIADDSDPKMASGMEHRGHLAFGLS